MSTAEEDEGNPYSLDSEALEERLHKKKYGRMGAQLFVGLLVCMSAVSFGSALAWSNPVTYHLEYGDRKYVLTPVKFALLVSMVPLGSSLGVVSWTYIKKHMGPKKCLLLQTPFYATTWAVLCIHSAPIQMAGRFFLGFLGIAHLVCAETLLVQTVHNDFKPYISVAFHTSIMVGVAFAQILGYVLGTVELTACCLVMPVTEFFLLFIIPESPVFLYAKNHRDAEKALIWYRGAENIYLEMRNIRKEWELTRVDPDSYKYMLHSKVVIKAILTVLMITLMDVCTGYYIFLFYSINVWNNQKIIVAPLIDCSIVSVYFVGCKVFWRTMHSRRQFKVRKMLLISSFMCAFVLSMLAMFLLLDSIQVDMHSGHQWIPLLCSVCIIFFHEMALDVYPKMLIVQYVPFQVSTRAYTINSVFMWSAVWLSTFTFGLIDVPSYVHFFTYAIIQYIGAMLIYCFVIEPLGKSLVQIQMEFGGNPVGNRGAMYIRAQTGQRETNLQEA